MRLQVDRQSQRTYKISPANRPTQWDRSIKITVCFTIASGTEIYTLVRHPALTIIFMALRHELGPLRLITCGRKEAATMADSVAADVLDSLAIKGTRVVLVPLALVPDTGVLELPLLALLVNLLPLFLYGFQTFLPLMYTKRPEVSPDPVQRATRFLIALRQGYSFDKWPSIWYVKQKLEAATLADSTATTTLES